jgi:hypothetical protein
MTLEKKVLRGTATAGIGSLVILRIDIKSSLAISQAT